MNSNPCQHPRFCLAVVALASVFTVSPALANDVTSVAIRNHRVAPEGELTLYAAFLNGKNKEVIDIHANDLVIEVDGELSSATPMLTPVTASPLGVAVLLAVDTSGTMRVAIPRLKAALKRYVAQLRPGIDFVAVGAIGNEWSLKRDFTADLEEINKAIDDLKADAVTTALFESVYEGVSMLEQRGDDLPARRFVIVLSDGLNEKEGRTPGECIALANRASMQVHSLLYLTRKTQRYLDAKGNLEKISRDTGAYTYTASDDAGIDVAISSLREHLAREIPITLPGDSLPSDGRRHDVKVNYKTARPDTISYTPLKRDKPLKRDRPLKERARKQWPLGATVL